MDKIRALTAALYVALLLTWAMFAPVPAIAQTFSTANTELPMPVAPGPLLGEYVARDVSTPTMTLSSYAQACPTLPAGTRYVTFLAQDGAFNYGPSTVTTSTGGVWPTVASGSSVSFAVNPLDPTPGIYFVANATGATPILRTLCIRR